MRNQRQRRWKSGCPSITATLAAAVLLSAGFYFYGSASPVQEVVAGDPDAAEKKAAVEMREQVERHGITWTFDQEYPVGQYVNGDYFVVTDTLVIVAINPPSLDDSGRIRHGSEINPGPAAGAVFGFDNDARQAVYDANLNVARPNGLDLSADNPLVLSSGSSLVSSITHKAGQSRPQLSDASVLTVVDTVPNIDSFRPPYSGRDKTSHFEYNQVQTDLLLRLEPVDEQPSMQSVAAGFERLWLDYIPGWQNRACNPTNNMPHYGQRIARATGDATLMLSLDYPPDEKRDLLIGFLQYGIDLWGVVNDGGTSNWVPNGGHASGRKWPILFAGVMFDDADMKNIGAGNGTGVAYFGEDAQTFYVTQAEIDATNDPNWYSLDRGHEWQRYDESHLGMPDWGIRHATDISRVDASWSRPYRTCCTAVAWSGYALIARLMGLMDLWGHPAFFDYQDRYMAIMNGDPCPFGYPAVTNQPTEHQELRANSDHYEGTDFAETMWDTYR